MSSGAQSSFFPEENPDCERKVTRELDIHVCLHDLVGLPVCLSVQDSRFFPEHPCWGMFRGDRPPDRCDSQGVGNGPGSSLKISKLVFTTVKRLSILLRLVPSGEFPASKAFLSTTPNPCICAPARSRNSFTGTLTMGVEPSQGWFHESVRNFLKPG